MSISHRKQRAAIYSHSDAGTGGIPMPLYTRQSSGDADHLWWCARVQVTGRETIQAGKPEHRIDAAFGFATEAPVTEDGAIVCDSVEYLVRTILRRDTGHDELLVYCEKAMEKLNLSP